MNGPSVKSALSPDPQPLWPGIGCSVFLHGGVGLFAIVISWIGPLLMAFFPSCQPEPLIADNVEVFSVSNLPKRLNVPDKAERVAKVKRPEVPAPKPPDPKPKPEPVKESDLVIEKKDVKPEPKGNTDDAAARKRALEELLEEPDDLLADAPIGETNRVPTDPNGVVGADPRLGSLRSGSKSDPEMAKWQSQVTAKLRQRFKPIGPRSDLKTVMHVWIDPESGRILRYEVAESSGALSFDKAAERAVAATGTIPIPPAKYKPLFAAEYVVVEMVQTE